MGLSELGRLHASSVDWLASQQETGLVRSFAVPQNDPDYGCESDGTQQAGCRLSQRSFIYDDALAVLAFLGANRSDRARAILTQLAKLQSDDGSLPFSVDGYLGPVVDDYRRTGALAWVGYAAVQYEFKTRSGEFRPCAERIASYLQSLQVTQATAGSRSPPYEFHVWPAAGGTAWAAIVTGHPTMLWAADGWADQYA